MKTRPTFLKTLIFKILFFYKCAQFWGALSLILVGLLVTWPIVKKWRFPQDDYLFSCQIHTKNLEWYLDYPSFRLLRLVHNYALDISVKYSAFNESIALQSSAFHLPRCISSRLYFLLKCNGMFKIYIIIRYNTVGFILWQKLAYPVFPNKLSYILFLGCSYDKKQIVQ